MAIIGIIPARGGSQRLPKKNLLPIHDKPLIAYTIEAALEASALDRVIVSTDSPDIAQIAKQFGAEVIMRPPELATDEAPIDDSLRHVVKELGQKEGVSTEIVVSMQANNPVRKKGEIDQSVARLIATPWATAVATAYKVDQRPEWSKLVVDEHTLEIKPFMDAGARYRMQDLPDLYLLDGSIIAVRAEVLEQTASDRRVHAYLGDRVTIKVHDSRFATEIDEAKDMELADYYLSLR
jgi:CMP-N,N'-diacetyllegionaminic acid synthase